jgi:hypothetical protein
MALDDVAQRYLASQGHGRLATVGSDGHPQNKPVGFHYNAELGTIWSPPPKPPAPSQRWRSTPW